MKKVLFIDRDGTLIVEPPDEQIDSLEKLEFYPGVFTWLGKIARETDYELVMVTNQDGLGTKKFPEETFWPAHNKLINALANEGIRFSEILIDRSLPHENKPTRKPGTALLTKYLNGQYDLKNSFTIGDRLTDVELARNMGTRGILLRSDLTEKIKESNLESHCVLATAHWKEIYKYLVSQDRTAAVKRTTHETDIEVNVKLNGSGMSTIQTGIGFFDHMLDQFSKHGGLDLSIKTRGDLRIDEHHTIEDTAIALGQAISSALGNKRGIERFGFHVPMDDCLAQVVIDFGGRPWLVWDVEFKREKIGEMPTEMFMHFFKSFSDHALCNLNIKAIGVNEHHKIEAIFKAFAKAVKMAVKKEGDELPTTKGLI